MKKIYFAIIAALALAYFSLKSTVVKVCSPKRGQSIEAVFATGTVEAKIMYPLATKYMGKLIELNVDEGEIIEKGKILAKLEDQKLLNTIEELEAKQKYLIEEYNRQEKLYKIKATARDALDKAKSDLDASVAAIKGAKSQLDEMSLKAPENAKIIKRDGEIGQMISANQAVFWLAEQGPLRITAEVDEEDISKIKSGQKVLIRSDAFENKVFNGSVDTITPKGDPIARSYRIRINFDEEVPFMIGMTTENNIILNENNQALLIPSSAVNKNSVWLVKNDILEKREIITGARDLKQTQVLSGLSEEDKIVIEPNDKLLIGQKIRTIE